MAQSLKCYRPGGPERGAEGLAPEVDDGGRLGAREEERRPRGRARGRKTHLTAEAGQTLEVLFLALSKPFFASQIFILHHSSR